METFWKTILWGQLGATIDMLENAIHACPDSLWSDPSKRPEWPSHDVVGFWHLAYHTVFFLDYDFTPAAEEYTPPPPFTLSELDPEGLLPDRPYTKAEVLSYLEQARRYCREAIANLSENSSSSLRGSNRTNRSDAELILYSMRHIQHHAAQLNYMLRKATGDAPRWVSTAKSPLTSH